MRKPTPKFAVGDQAVCRGIYPPTGSAILAGSHVTVEEVSLQKYGRGRCDWSEPRYRVRWAGVSLWTDENGLRTLADAQEGSKE